MKDTMNMQRCSNSVKILFLLNCSLFSFIHAKRETFADVFKPLKVEYLYQLLDKHPEMRDKLDDMFRIKKKYNEKRKGNKKVISYSLFWKAPLASQKPPIVNKRTIYSKSATVKRVESFYNMYAVPLMQQLKNFKKFYPDWIARVYLSADLEFLIPKLSGPDVEIFVMGSNSIAAAPGAMWRFLVFDDPRVKVAYVKDADKSLERLDGNFIKAKMVQKWAKSKKTRGFFRLRDMNYVASVAIPRNKWYSPISASCFGAKKVDWINMEKAMKGYILHRILFPDELRHRKDIVFDGHPYGFGNEFPSYGFDERFLKHVLYFEAAHRDELTLILTGKKLNKFPPANWVRLDLDYTKNKIFS